MRTVFLIGGGKSPVRGSARARALAPHVVAADSGAEAALAHGVTRNAVIGDFDSLGAASTPRLAARGACTRSPSRTAPISTSACATSAPLVIGIGFSGDRLDHQLAAYNTLVRHPARRCVLLGAEELVFLCPPSVSLPVADGTPLSLFRWRGRGRLRRAALAHRRAELRPGRARGHLEHGHRHGASVGHRAQDAGHPARVRAGDGGGGAGGDQAAWPAMSARLRAAVTGRRSRWRSRKKTNRPEPTISAIPQAERVGKVGRSNTRSRWRRRSPGTGSVPRARPAQRPARS